MIFSNVSEEARTFKALLSSFPGQKLFITSQTLDGQKSIIFTESDTSLGAYYFFDKQKGELSLLHESLPEVNSELLSKSTPIQFKTSDGMNIHGYFNKAVGKDTKPAPLITLIHGGPHGVRDYWAYDSEVQMLANQGYAVLRLNYRGSGGYGRTFENAGYLHWGDLIQQDIIEGTQWAIANHHIDKNRVCVMGTSFGAYSAMQSAILEPDLFKCVVATAGIYDLELMYKEGDIIDLYWGGRYLKSAIGEDKIQLKKFSPVNNIAKLKAEVLIAHGKEDSRAPFEHAEILMDNLKKANKKYRFLGFERETHGFYAEHNRRTYFEEVASFLREKLK